MLRFLRRRLLRNPIEVGPLHPGGGRIYLRPYSELNDFAALRRLHESREVQGGLGWRPRTERESWEHLRARARHIRLQRRDDFAVWAIETYPGGVVGDISGHLRVSHTGDVYVELGWVVHPDFQGNGYAREAIDAIVAHITETQTSIHYVTARIRAANTPSRRLAEAAGMREHNNSHRGEMVHYRRYLLNPFLANLGKED